MKLVDVVKKSGVNHVVVTLVLSRPILVVVSRFALHFSGVTASQFSYEVSQNSANLSVLTIAITYGASLQDQNMTISYTSARRRLQEESYNRAEINQNQPNTNFNDAVNGRLLATITFSGSFSVTSYPPASYYPDSTLNAFNLLRKYIAALSVALIVLCFILVPKRMHLHAATLIYIPAQIYISYVLTPSKYTDWL
jgi:hypothetical protein